MKAFLRKVTIGGADYLQPANKETAKYVTRRNSGQVLVTDIKQCRNYENHKRAFSFLDTAFDMQEFYPTKEALRRWITVSSGWYEVIIFPDGKTQLYPKSWKFEEMEEPEFIELFKAMIGTFLDEFSGGMTENEFMRIIDYD